jgi:hypothetical protein
VHAGGEMSRAAYLKNESTGEEKKKLIGGASTQTQREKQTRQQQQKAQNEIKNESQERGEYQV